MALDSPTYTLATPRQWVSLKVANIAIFLTMALAVVWSFRLWQLSSNSTVSEAEAQVYAWSYGVDERGTVIAQAYPPILMWVGLFIFVTWATSLGPDRRGLGVAPNMALTGPFSTEQQRIGKPPRSERRRRWRDALRNLKRQLRERGNAGLLRGRVTLRVALGMLGAGLVVVTSLLAPTTMGATGSSISDTQRGSLPWISLVGGGLAFILLLLSFPYGPREQVTVDGAGNVHHAVPNEVAEPQQRPTPTAGDRVL